MPILNDIMDHKVIGPAIRQGLEQGRRENREAAKQEEAVIILRRLIAKRFGTLPTSVEDRDRFVDATSMTDLFDCEPNKKRAGSYNSRTITIVISSCWSAPAVNASTRSRI